MGIIVKIILPFFLSLIDGISDKLLIIGKLTLNLLYLIFEPNLNHLSIMVNICTKYCLAIIRLILF